MKTIKGTATLLLYRYIYPRKSAPLDVPVYIVGDIAVHRDVFWHDGETPKLADDPSRKRWGVSHIPTGSTLSRCLPLDLTRRNVKKAELEHWAREFQARAPQFFDAVRPLGLGETLEMNDVNKKLARAAMTIGKGI